MKLKLVLIQFFLVLTFMNLWSQQNLKKFMKKYNMDLCPSTQKMDSASLMSNIILLQQYVAENKNFDPKAYYMIAMEYFKISGVKDTSNSMKYYCLYINHPKAKNRASAWWNMALTYYFMPDKDCSKILYCLNNWKALAKNKSLTNYKDEALLRDYCSD